MTAGTSRGIWGTTFGKNNAKCAQAVMRRLEHRKGPRGNFRVNPKWLKSDEGMRDETNDRDIFEDHKAELPPSGHKTLQSPLLPSHCTRGTESGAYGVCSESRQIKPPLGAVNGHACTDILA